MNEYNLTIMDIDWEDGQEYMIQIGCDDPFRVVVSEGDLHLVDDDGYMGEEITRCYTLEELALANLERCIDWASVPVDTKVLVKRVEEDTWKKRYFAKYENGKVHTWAYRATSWSEENGETFPWNLAKLATEED